MARHAKTPLDNVCCFRYETQHIGNRDDYLSCARCNKYAEEVTVELWLLLVIPDWMPKKLMYGIKDHKLVFLTKERWKEVFAERDELRCLAFIEI
jgi:hypothetical protein